jgi:hypothetical protein
LRRHPLAHLNLVGTRCQDSNNDGERGAVLHNVLREAIESANAARSCTTCSARPSNLSSQRVKIPTI